MARRNNASSTTPPPAAGNAAMQCQVCEQQPSKYKCPGCALRYCSVACCQAHKAAPCPGPNGGGVITGPPSRSGADDHSRKRGREWQPPSSRRGQHGRGGQADDYGQGEEDDLEALLTPEMQGALRESKWLQGALGDSTLRRLLADIDGGSGGGGGGGSVAGRDKAARLKEALEKYPDLQAFVDRMLMEVGALKYEDGRLVLA